MSLDTLIKIGKVFREQSKRPMRHFRFVERPKEKKDEVVYYLSVPVSSDFSFGWDRITVVPENKRDQLYYFKYKTSSQDSSKAKYLFGDIYYESKKQKESGNFWGVYSQTDNSFESSKGVMRNLLTTLFKERDPHAKSKVLKDRLDRVFSYIDGTDGNPEFYSQVYKDYRLVEYWRCFKRSIGNVQALLKYAPVVKPGPLDVAALEHDYIKYLCETNKSAKKLLAQREIAELSDNDKLNILKQSSHAVFLHFDFECEEQWYNCKDMLEQVVDTLSSQIIESQENRLVMTTTLYNTLCSGDNKNDIQFPDFAKSNSYKSFSFATLDAFKDFLYSAAIFSSANARESINYSKTKIFVLPVSLNESEIDAEDYENFFFSKAKEDSLFSFNFLDFDESDVRFHKFDFVFIDFSGKAPRTLLELSGINRSLLAEVKDRIRRIESEVSQMMQDGLPYKTGNLTLEESLRNIFGNITVSDGNVKISAHNSKLEIFAGYHSVLMKILPKIYMANYYEDGMILPEVVGKAEFAARNGDKAFYIFHNLKYCMILLMNVQNNKKSNYMKIVESQSYQIGLLLGSMAKGLSGKINSFEKNYVGSLSRRIATLGDLLNLKADLEEKLILHDQKNFIKKESYELAQKLKSFTGAYDKNECSFGFFESYYKPYESKAENGGNNSNDNNN